MVTMVHMHWVESIRVTPIQIQSKVLELPEEAQAQT